MFVLQCNTPGNDIAVFARLKCPLEVTAKCEYNHRYTGT